MSWTIGYGFKRRSYILYHNSRHFFSTQWAGGVVLLFFVVVAMLLANLPTTAEFYHNLIHAPVGVTVGGFDLHFNLEKFVNDGLMMIFFFSVGLEIKREIVSGHLSSLQKAILPVAGALGGMLAPALIYTIFTHGTPYAHGWGIPMATDIAFAIAIMSIVGRQVPVAMKVFLTALAVADDLGSILVIAIFYGTTIHFELLLMAAAVLLIAWILNNLKVSELLVYVVLGIALWLLFYHSGIHATIAGVLLAMFVPSKPKYNKKYFIHKVRFLMEDFVQKDREVAVTENEEQMADLYRIRHIALDSASLSQRFEHLLSPWVNFVIMPLFALVNAGVPVESLGDLNVFSTPLGMGVVFGLWVGKPLGIILMSWLFVKAKLAEMPEGVHWGMFAAVACLGGIGFTMSIFMDTLAFAAQPHFVAEGKIAVLLGSVIAAITGMVAVRWAHRWAVRHGRVAADCAESQK